MTVDAEKVFGKHYEFDGERGRTHDRERITDGISAAKGQYHGLNRESHGEEVSGTRKCLFEVDDFCARSIREVGGVLQIHGQGAE